MIAASSLSCRWIFLKDDVSLMFMCEQVFVGGSGGPGQQSQETQLQAFCSQRAAYRSLPQAF